jgi:hypothetical protein
LDLEKIVFVFVILLLTCSVFVTAGGDGIVNVYDARKFEKLNSFVSPGVSAIAVSQTGLLAVAHGKKISVCFRYFEFLL